MASENQTVEERKSILQAQAFGWNLTFSFMKSMCLKCVVELGIIDLIHSHGGTLALSELVEALNLHPSRAHPLHRLMRLLVRLGLFAKTSDDGKGEEIRYTLTSISRLFLQSDLVGAANTKYLLMILDSATLSPWQELGRWFHSDNLTAYEMLNGRNFWEDLPDNPVLVERFEAAMMWDSRIVSVAVVEEYKGVFERVTSLVDVAGGSGAMMEAIAEAFPHIHCIVLDLPQAISEKKGDKNLEFVSGDMFQSIPSAHAVLLKWIIHNWDDEKSIDILKNCKKAIPSKEQGGKVIIIDMVMNEAEEDDAAKESQIFLDLQMMVFLNGSERNLKEWERLFFEAGFSGYNIVGKLGARSLIELYP